MHIALVAAVAALGGLLFGYDMGVISGALLFLRQAFDLSPFMQGVVTSIALAGAAVYSALLGFISLWAPYTAMPHWWRNFSPNAGAAVVTWFTFLPSFLLTGFIYSIQGMPLPIQLFNYLVPARHFIVLLRGIFLKGVGAGVLWVELAFLTFYALVVFAIASRKARQKIA